MLNRWLKIHFAVSLSPSLLILCIDTSLKFPLGPAYAYFFFFIRVWKYALLEHHQLPAIKLSKRTSDNFETLLKETTLSARKLSEQNTCNLLSVSQETN